MAVDRVRLWRIRKVGIGGEHVFPLCIADVVKEGRRRRLGGERLVVVDEFEHVLLVREVAAGTGDGPHAVADPLERLGGELELVHPVDGELEARDPHPGGWVGVAGPAGCDGRELSMDENNRARVRHGNVRMSAQDKRVLDSFDT